MKIRLIWTGKTKEPFISEGIAKYLALVKPYAGVAVTEIKEEKGKDIPRMLEKEAERIGRLNIPYVLLDEGGKKFTSRQFAAFVESRAPRVNFLIGGPYGVSEKVKKAGGDVISLSPMTLTHEMARLLLLEQIYRAFTIIHNKGYHH
jgi:23S rRNA (pseudouridine1915-N3)-methyltransferase